MRLLFDLFLTFFKIGLFTFGGGYAMISVMEDICVEKKKWITHDEMMNITVIAESTPGPIAINCATFVGYKRKGLSGAFATLLGVILPSFIIILLIAFLLDNFLEVKIVANAFKGIKLAVGVLILEAAINMIIKMHKEILPCLILIFSSVCMLLIDIFSWNFSVIALMLAAGAVSLIFFIIMEKSRKAGDKK